MKPILKIIALSVCLLATTGLASAEELLNVQPRIVGGARVDIADAPATVALVNNNRIASSGSFLQSQFCGGTIINPRWVLTAAHCVLRNGRTLPAADIAVMMGSNNLDQPVNLPVNVTQIIAHAGYSPVTNANDIALLRLEHDALSAAVPMEVEPNQLNDLAFIVGWGALNARTEGQQQTFPRQLQGAFLLMVPGTDCADRFTRYRTLVTDSNLCAGVPEGGIDTCQGDSGGPMYRYNRENPADLRLAGITSWGFGCGGAQTPGVYTRVAAFRNWIAANTADSTLAQPVLDPTVEPTFDPIVQPAAVPGIEELAEPGNPPPVQTTPPGATTSPMALQGSESLSDTNSLSAPVRSSSGATGIFLLPLLALVLLLRSGLKRGFEQSLRIMPTFNRTTTANHRTITAGLARRKKDRRSAVARVTTKSTKSDADARIKASAETRAEIRATARTAAQANARSAAHANLRTDSTGASSERFTWREKPHGDVRRAADTHSDTSQQRNRRHTDQRNSQVLLLWFYPMALASIVLSVAALALWVQQSKAGQMPDRTTDQCCVIEQTESRYASLHQTKFRT